METPRSAIGRLLSEIYWEGTTSGYREGGRGLENVLTAEVFQVLDFLPRANFLGRVIRSAQGATKTLQLLADEVEQAALGLLPGDIYLGERPPVPGDHVHAQPDGIIQTPSVYCLLEAKRIRRGAFQSHQLAREFIAVLQEANGRSPLLLLVLPKPPPLLVKSHGRMSLHDAVGRWLEPEIERIHAELPSMDELLDRIDSTVAFTTWTDVSECVAAGLQAFQTSDRSVADSVARLAAAAQEAIAWHT